MIIVRYVVTVKPHPANPQWRAGKWESGILIIKPILMKHIVSCVVLVRIPVSQIPGHGGF
jgi:hypothetical protein